MKVVILAGGKGRRLCSESTNIPKPLVEIGGIPIICHVMHYFEQYGYHDFVIALGYEGGRIIDAIARYMGVQNFTEDRTAAGEHFVRLGSGESGWNVTLMDTGMETATGGRLKRLEPFLEESFFLAWCDGVSDIRLDRMADFHKRHGRMVTVAAVHPHSRFGVLQLQDELVTGFREKPRLSDQWINSGYFIVDKLALQFIAGDSDQWEITPVTRLVDRQQLMVWRHEGSWLCMDTIQDWEVLEEMWTSGKAFWSDKNE